MKVQQSIVVNAPISTVFQTFSNLALVKKHLSGVTKLDLLEGPEQMQPGTKWRETRVMMGKESTEEMWVTELNQNRNYKVSAESHGTKYLSEFLFEELDGGTKVTWVFEGIPQTIMAKLMSVMGALFADSLKKMMLQDMDDLKKVCEDAK